MNDIVTELDTWFERALVGANPGSRGVRSDADLNRWLAKSEGETPDNSDEIIKSIGEPRPASVLVPIIKRPDPTILLTKRNGNLNKHAGQVSFPGGRIDAGDRDAEAAALRETHEEVGITSDYVSIKGRLDTYYTGTGFVITPIVGLLEPDFTVVKQEDEVEEVFEVPLSFILDRQNHKNESAVWKGMRRHYYTMPYEGYFIWGATAAMLVNLVDILEAVKEDI